MRHVLRARLGRHRPPGSRAHRRRLRRPHGLHPHHQARLFIPRGGPLRRTRHPPRLVVDEHDLPLCIRPDGLLPLRRGTLLRLHPVRHLPDHPQPHSGRLRRGCDQPVPGHYQPLPLLARDPAHAPGRGQLSARRARRLAPWSRPYPEPVDGENGSSASMSIAPPGQWCELALNGTSLWCMGCCTGCTCRAQPLALRVMWMCGCLSESCVPIVVFFVVLHR
mmetsp:Transcript_19351/g.32850  ORF Transcript_19351/g.32850 Transcript_19351/m.32850 type:complete len:221 (-) Transcript_19351:146-808(-)